MTVESRLDAAARERRSSEAGRRAVMEDGFAARFGVRPTTWCRAPGRVDLMGSHTDYNLGPVLTMTIDRDTWVAARPRDDRRVRVTSLDLPGDAEFRLDRIEHDRVTPWTDYVRGVAAALLGAGYPLVGFDGLVASTIPFGSGLSSSAAIDVAIAVTFEAVSGFRLEPLDLALLAQRAENQFVGVQCGILDQYTSVMGSAGHALLLDCRDLVSRAVAIAPELAVVVCDTRAERRLGATGFGERRAQCEEGVAILRTFVPAIGSLRDVSPALLEAHAEALPAVVRRRCRFIIEEAARVVELAAALPIGDRSTIGRLLADSYAGATGLYEIGAPAMSAMIAAMRSAPGFVGGRQAGAGFGGSMVAIVKREAVAQFARHVDEAYAAATGITTRTFAVEASSGAGILEQAAR